MDDVEILNYWNRGDYEHIIKNYNIKYFTENFQVFFFIDAHLQLNLIEKAQSLLNEYFQISDIDNESKAIRYLLLGRLASRQNDFSKAEDFVTKIHKLTIKDSEWIVFFAEELKALILFAKNEFISSLNLLEVLENKNQNLLSKFKKFNNAYYYTLKGLSEWKIGEKQKALFSIETAKDINVSFNKKRTLAYNYFIRGQIRIELGEFLKGLTDFEEAKKLYLVNKDDHGKNTVLLATAEVKFMQGRLTEALEIFKSSLKSFEGNDYYLSDIYYLIGRIFQKQRDFEKAKWNYEKAINLSAKLNLVFQQSLAILHNIDLLVEYKEFEKIPFYNQMINVKSDDKTIQLIKLMIDALIFQSKYNYKEAKKSWIFVSSNENLPFILQIYALENALKTSILCWKEEKELSLLRDIETIFEKWEKLATDNFLGSSLATIYLLKAKFFLAVIQVSEAEHFLEEGLKLVEKYGLEVDREDITKDQEKIHKIIQLKNTKADTEKEISLDEMLDYLKNAKTNMLIQK